MRQWISLFEAFDYDEDRQEFVEYIAEIMKEASDRESFWVMSDGAHYTIPRIGAHENVAFLHYGESEKQRYASKSEQQMKRQYGHLFQGWKYFDYNDVAMMDGWIRVMIDGRTQSIAIEMIKGKASVAAKLTINQIIRADIAQDYYFEFNTGHDTPDNNFKISDSRQALRLLISN